jgi:putative hydrolase of the HAD superfamily
MTVAAVLFDIGGILEKTPDLGVTAKWEALLGLGPGELDRRMGDVWRAGSIGTVSEAQVTEALASRLRLDGTTCEAFLADMWREYLGTADIELIDYARTLRPRYRTGIISNSFVGAREREQAAYGFEDLVDDIVYSHEVGFQKPDARIYELACRRLHVEPAATVFVDDRQEAVDGAAAVGLRAVLHTGDSAETIRALRRLLLPTDQSSAGRSDR